MDGQGITTEINLSASFAEAKSAVQPLDVAPMVAVTPSQMMNGGKMPATPDNARKLGMLNA